MKKILLFMCASVVVLGLYAQDTAVSGKVNYAALKTGLTELLDDLNGLNVDDYQTLHIVSKLKDGREVKSSSKIRITADNPYSGTYVSSGTRWNFNTAGNVNIGTMFPAGFVSATDWTFNTRVTAVDAITCKVQAANLNGDFGTINIKINHDNTVDIISTDNTGLPALIPLPGYVSTYDPVAKKFTLFYQYTNDAGTHRVLRHYLLRK